MQLGVFMERAAGFLDRPCSPASEAAEYARKATVTLEQECSMLKSSTNGLFLSAMDSGAESGVAIENTEPSER